ncbi:MAG: hypothetical protein I8H68_06060 [Flavobacteriia bacterium]|nr:hypothetical protein [Flavobacteriia bacterium]MBH2024306.1 hypothetical protein [Flavobacteriales bacterium]
MKKIFFAIFSCLTMMIDAQDLTDFRLLLQKGENSESATKTLINNSKETYTKTKKPIYEAFYAVGNFFMAKHAVNPWNKFSYFNKGKKALDNAISKDPNNLEIRFMRYISQEQTPAFLGYNKDLKIDKNFILAEYKKSKDEDLNKRIKMHLKL